MFSCIVLYLNYHQCQIFEIYLAENSLPFFQDDLTIIIFYSIIIPCNNQLLQSKISEQLFFKEHIWSAASVEIHYIINPFNANVCIYFNVFNILEQVLQNTRKR